MKTRVLFVCLGNICRSPAAEAYCAVWLKIGRRSLLQVDSAGTYGGHAGDLPDARMRIAAQRRGYSLTHHAAESSRRISTVFDMIVVMDEMNYEAVHRLAPSRVAAEKISG